MLSCCESGCGTNAKCRSFNRSGGPISHTTAIAKPIQIKPHHFIRMKKKSCLGANTSRSPVCSSRKCAQGHEKDIGRSHQQQAMPMTMDNWWVSQYSFPLRLLVINSAINEHTNAITGTRIPRPHQINMDHSPPPRAVIFARFLLNVLRVSCLARDAPVTPRTNRLIVVCRYPRVDRCPHGNTSR